MISYIAVCIGRPMPVEVAEILLGGGLAILVIVAIAVATAGQRVKE